MGFIGYDGVPFTSIDPFNTNFGVGSVMPSIDNTTPAESTMVKAEKSILGDAFNNALGSVIEGGGAALGKAMTGWLGNDRSDRERDVYGTNPARANAPAPIVKPQNNWMIFAGLGLAGIATVAGIVALR